MRIAIAQMNTTEGDFDTTAKRILCQAQLAADEGSDLIVFPLPVLTGPSAGVLAASSEFLFDIVMTFSELASKMPIAALIPLATDIDEDAVFDVILIEDNQIKPLRLSKLMGALEVGLGQRRGSLAPIAFTFKDIHFGIVFDKQTLEDYVQTSPEADILLYLNASGFDTDEPYTCLAPAISEGAFIQEAQQSSCWIVAVGGVGGYAEQVFVGGSFVMDDEGRLFYASPTCEEDLAVLDINFDESVHKTIQKPPVYSRIEQLWQALVLVARDYVVKQHKDSIVVPIFGDLPSSILLCLAKDALGAASVHGLLPSFIQGQARKDALYLMEKEGIAFNEMDMGDEFDRGLISLGLADSSRATSSIIFVPDDKTALALEADEHDLRCVRSYAPFGDVYRSDLISLAEYRQKTNPSIPEEAILRFDIPSVVGIPDTNPRTALSIIDAILFSHVEQAQGVTAVAEMQKEELLVSAVIGKMRQGDYARRFMPIMPIVSARTLAECEFPLGTAWSDRSRDDFDEDLLEDLQTAAEEGFAEMDPEAILEDMGMKVMPVRMEVHDEAMDRSVADMIGYAMDLMHATVSEEPENMWGINLFSKN